MFIQKILNTCSINFTRYKSSRVCLSRSFVNSNRFLSSKSEIYAVRMENIKDVKIENLTESNFVCPLRMKYSQNGKSKIWDLINVHESVAVIVFHKIKKKLVFVKQFRPAVYFNGLPRDGFLADKRDVSPEDLSKFPPSTGVTIELCAGIVDKTKNLAATAQAEVMEECGYSVPMDKFQRVICFRSGVGVSGEKQTLFYVEVDDTHKVNEGGGCSEEGELIDVIEMSIDEIEEYLSREDVNSPSALLFGVTWFLRNKIDVFKK